MNRNCALDRTMQFGLLATLCIFGRPYAQGAESQNLRTNWIDRAITNQIEVRMPRNVFVDEYHTNWVDLQTTNFVSLYRTNHVTRVVTNRFVVDAFQTNVVDAYNTNWQKVTLTNQVAVRAFNTNVVTDYKTNWQTVTLTKEVAVDRYRTNVKTLTLTNWESVLVFKTNFVSRSMTNVVDLDVPVSRSALAAGSSTEDPHKRAENSVALRPAPEGLTLEASKSSRAPIGSQLEVLMRVKSTLENSTVPPIQRWRVEKIDGAVLLFEQGQEFKRDLFPGKYKVEAKLPNDANGQPVSVRGVLEVTAHEAFIQQKLLGKR